MPNDTAVTVANNAIAPPPERRCRLEEEEIEEIEEVEEDEEEFGPKGGGLINCGDFDENDKNEIKKMKKTLSAFRFSFFFQNFSIFLYPHNTTSLVV